MQCLSIIRCVESTTGPKWNFPFITRPNSILYYVLEGRAFYKIGDEEEKAFEVGHLYVFPANRVYSLRCDLQNQMHRLSVHATTSPPINKLIDIDVESDPFIKQTLSLMRTYVKASDKIYIQELTEMLLSYIYNTTLSEDSPLHARLKRYIEANFLSVFHREDLSAHFNYSSSHLSKIFKQAYDITPQQYAKLLVLREIIDAIRRGESVTHIATKFGFSSPENMSRFFKKHFGCSPTNYLKQS